MFPYYNANTALYVLICTMEKMFNFHNGKWDNDRIVTIHRLRTLGYLSKISFTLIVFATAGRLGVKGGKIF